MKDKARNTKPVDPRPEDEPSRAGKEREIRVLLVEDHPILREGLKGRINGEPGLTVCGEADTARAAGEAIAQLKPDVLVLDISLKEGDGMDLLKDIKIQHPGLKVLVLSMHDESLYAERALRAGAKGYVMKQEPPEKVMEAIRKVAAGDTYLSPVMTKTLIGRISGQTAPPTGLGLDALTDRELQVYQLIARGRGLQEIGQNLHLSVKTVASHRENIKHKLNLKSGAELLRHALQWARDHLEG